MTDDWHSYEESPYLSVYNQIFSKYKHDSVTTNPSRKIEYQETCLASMCHLHELMGVQIQDIAKAYGQFEGQKPSKLQNGSEANVKIEEPYICNKYNSNRKKNHSNFTDVTTVTDDDIISSASIFSEENKKIAPNKKTPIISEQYKELENLQTKRNPDIQHDEFIFVNKKHRQDTSEKNSYNENNFKSPEKNKLFCNNTKASNVINLFNHSGQSQQAPNQFNNQFNNSPSFLKTASPKSYKGASGFSKKFKRNANIVIEVDNSVKESFNDKFSNNQYNGQINDTKQVRHELYEDQQENKLKGKQMKKGYNIREMSKTNCRMCNKVVGLLLNNKDIDYAAHEHNCEDHKCSTDQMDAEMPNFFGEVQSLENNNYDFNFEL